MTEQTTTMEGYSYRVSARFGSRVQVSVGGDTVSVTGPRVSLLSYRLWIGTQAVLLALVALSLVAAVAIWDWRCLVAALALLLAHLAVGGFGAGCLWEMMNLSAFSEGRLGDRVSFPLSAVRGVKIGRGWARRWMWLLILPYVGGINQAAEGYCVSFEAPDGAPQGAPKGIVDRDVVYALHMSTPDDAQTLARLLSYQSRDREA